MQSSSLVTTPVPPTAHLARVGPHIAFTMESNEGFQAAFEEGTAEVDNAPLPNEKLLDNSADVARSNVPDAEAEKAARTTDKPLIRETQVDSKLVLKVSGTQTQEFPRCSTDRTTKPPTPSADQIGGKEGGHYDADAATESTEVMGASQLNIRNNTSKRAKIGDVDIHATSTARSKTMPIEPVDQASIRRGKRTLLTPVQPYMGISVPEDRAASAKPQTREQKIALAFAQHRTDGHTESRNPAIPLRLANSVTALNEQVVTSAKQPVGSRPNNEEAAHSEMSLRDNTLQTVRSATPLPQPHPITFRNTQHAGAQTTPAPTENAAAHEKVAPIPSGAVSQSAIPLLEGAPIASANLIEVATAQSENDRPKRAFETHSQPLTSQASASKQVSQVRQSANLSFQPTTATEALLKNTEGSEQRLSEINFSTTRSESAQPYFPTTAATQTELSPHIARQLADVLAQSPNRPIEITLAPEELGRLRLTVKISDAGVVVNLLAERPETLDLLRRNIEQLGQDFQALGYDNITFSFSGNETDTKADASPKDDDTEQLVAAETTTDIAQISLRNGATSGLDLRL